MKNFKGFTLIELLLVMAIMGILMTTLIVGINPARQFAKSRDSQRESHVYAILTTVLQYSQEHSGAWPDTDGDPQTSDFPTTLTCIGNDPGCFDLASAGDEGDTIVPYYLAELPVDPKTGDQADTGYEIMVNDYGRLVASASGETKTIGLTK